MTDLAIFLMDLDGGGAERVMLNLARGFADLGLIVDLVLVKPEGPYLSQLPTNVTLVKLGSSRLLTSLPALIKYLQKNQPKILMSALEDTNMVALWAKKLSGVTTKVVVTVHNHLSTEAANATSIKRKLTPRLVQLFYPLADRIIAVSEGVAQNLVALGLPTEKIAAIYNPIVTEELTQKIQTSIEHPWFAIDRPPVILGVGRLEKQKDFATLIRAFAKVRGQRSVRLMILGLGSQQKTLEALVQELNIVSDVSFLGFVANPYAYMAKASVVVLSSAWEGFGNVLVEAMAAGTPVVSTDCLCGPAEILQEGKYGKLVTVGDSNAMAEAIVAQLDTPVDRLVLQQRSQKFSLQAALQKYQQVLQI